MRVASTLWMVVAAGLLSTVALAAERSAPGEAARSCPQHGPGFIQVPGSSTCIRIGGRVRSEYGVSTRTVPRDRIAGFGTSGTVSLDSRTDTGYGPLRTYVRVRAGSQTGPR